MKEYDLGFVSGPTESIRLTDPQWFQIFLSGEFKGQRLHWFQPKDDESKRVTFLENIPDGAQLS